MLLPWRPLLPIHDGWLNMAETEINFMAVSASIRLDNRKPDGGGSGGMGKRPKCKEGTHPIDLRSACCSAEFRKHNLSVED